MYDFDNMNGGNTGIRCSDMRGHTLEHDILGDMVRDIHADAGHGDEAAILLLVHSLRGDHVAHTGTGHPGHLSGGDTGAGVAMDGEVVTWLCLAGTTHAQVTGTN